MYSDNDLQSAVQAGAISQDSADALRGHVASLSSTPGVDEEHFRLITGFNDIFVSIASVLLLIATGSLGALINDAMGGVAVAVTAWGLAEYFTRQKRMALPSIILMLAFAGGVAAAAGNFLGIEHAGSERVGAMLAAATAGITAIATWFHWRRFMVPITIAALTAAAVACVIALIISVVPFSETFALWLVFAGGLTVFALAMRWDMSDLQRKTRRSDVAFWLHLLAAPAIAHPIFAQLGVIDGVIGTGGAITVILLYVAFGLVALAIDRRAILVSGLAYVIYAISELFKSAQTLELGFALSALVIGSALLTLSAFWSPIRGALINGLPDGLRTRLPSSMPQVTSQQPA